ncbi:MAG: P-loop NTPase fold protein [Bacteroidota bacterium]
MSAVSNLAVKAISFSAVTSFGGKVSIIGKNLKIKYKDFFNFRNCIICFDDLERLSPEYRYEDFLGFINSNFVEHEGIKVIIICNEEEIISKEREDKKEEKTKYEVIKEKVIGRTLAFKVDIKDAIPSFVYSFKELNFTFYKCLKEHQEFLEKKL